MKRNDPETVADELRRELLEVGAVPRELTPLPGQAERAEQALQRIIAVPQEQPPQRIPPPRHQRPRTHQRVIRGTLLTAAAAAAAVALVVAQPQQAVPPIHAATPPLLAFENTDPGSIPTDGAPAAAALQRLASLADQQTPPAPLPVQHVSVEAWWAATGEEADGTTTSVLEPVERDSYFQPDGTMRSIERRGAPLVEGRLEAEGEGETIADESFASMDPGPGYADSLPVEPDALATRLATAHDPSSCSQTSGACLMSDVVDLFHNYVISPQLTSALWRVLSTDPTITYLGESRDRLGRPADVFSTPGEDGVSQRLLLISPTTGAYLGEEVVLTEPSDLYDFRPPAVVSFSALVESERVGTTSLPPGR
ncbi:CU044_5270 family protein [Nocardioides sp. R1-1]|uniref:CU044_5270 family protein n=1 Tax=Nocardioides sp. R1-1 TaxID=3383502 RepID=UPI0038CF4B1C